MYRKSGRPIFLSMIFLLLSSSVALASEWESLGQWNVKRTKKVADIFVKNKTPYKAIKLRIGTVGVLIRNISVIFVDDEEYVSEINQAISPRGETKTIFLPENQKAIRKVRFTYKAKKRSIITLWASTDTFETETSPAEGIQTNE